MEIQDIKNKLTLATVLHYYGLKPDKQLRLKCPFHNDKTPSMQVYYKTHTAYCFSANCKTHGKSLDVIDFIMNKEELTKHQAIKKAVQILGGGLRQAQPPRQVQLPTKNTEQDTDQHRIEFLERMFIYFKNAIPNSKPTQEYLQSRKLDFQKIEVGYNSGQFHHGARKDESLINDCLKYGLLLDLGLTARTGNTAYKPFGKWGVCFPLKNRHGRIVSFYFRSIQDDNKQRHYYLKDRQGLYPSYPQSNTKTLILTESIIDCATLQSESVLERSGLNSCSLLSLYGTNGFTQEHSEAIKSLTELEEIIFFLNGDEPGIKAVEKYAPIFKAEYPDCALSVVEVPQNEDVNSLLQGHSAEILIHLLDTRKECNFLFYEQSFSFSNGVRENSSNEKKSNEISIEKEKQVLEQNGLKPNSEAVLDSLNTNNPHNLHYGGKIADYYIKGGIRCALDALKISLHIVSKESTAEIRSKVDLYEFKQVESLVKSASDKLYVSSEHLEQDLTILTNHLENYRAETMKNRNNQNKKPEIHLPESTVNECVNFLKSSDLIDRITELLGKSGITGEELNRIFLFVIASSYKMPDTLHALIQGSSGSGKTRLLKIMCELMPTEDVIKFTRVTDNSFYNYREDYLVNKLLGFEDIDGLKEEAMYAVRELISNEILTSSTTSKTEDGQIMAVERTVRGPIASLSCTTKGEIYEDNMSRVFLIAVDESKEQTKRIIEYQQQIAAGLIDKEEQKRTATFAQNCIRLLKPLPVINPFAHKIHLPEEAHKIRRLNDLYLSFVKQITLLHQYQRRKDVQGRLISTKADLQKANEIMFESILLKVDELDGSLRQFFEKLKNYVSSLGAKDKEFILREVRQSLNISKTQLHRYITDLVGLEYLQQTGHPNKGYKYKICFWDNIEVLRTRIKNKLDEQINNLPEA